MSVTTWFRESRWALLAAAVLVPVAGAVAFTGRFVPYLEQNAVETVAAGFGESVEYAGSRFTLTGLRVVDGAEAGAREGRDVVVATWDVVVEEPPATSRCASVIVATIDGIAREWEAEPFLPLDLGIDDDEFEEFCDLSEPRSFELLQTYLVPAGVVDSPVVELSTPAVSPLVVRFTE